MKRNYVCLLLSFMLVLGGCAQKTEPQFSTATTSDLQDSTPQTDTLLPVVNLPDELYQVDESAYADVLRHDFTIEKKTEMTITVEVDAGTLSIGIKDRNSKKYVYDMKEFQSEIDSVTLEKGKYSIVIHKSEFTGSYRIQGTACGDFVNALQ